AAGASAAVTSSDHAVPFRAEATGSITERHSTPLGTLLRFATHGDGLHLGVYDSVGFALVNGAQVVGEEIFTAANGASFVKFFSGTFQSDGSLQGTYTLGNGTGRLAGISGSGDFTTTFDADGVGFSLVLTGEILFADHGKH